MRRGRYPPFAPCRITESYRHPCERKHHFDNGTLQVHQEVTRYIKREPGAVASWSKRAERV